MIVRSRPGGDSQNLRDYTHRLGAGLTDLALPVTVLNVLCFQVDVAHPQQRQDQLEQPHLFRAGHPQRGEGLEHVGQEGRVTQVPRLDTRGGGQVCVIRSRFHIRRKFRELLLDPSIGEQVEDVVVALVQWSVGDSRAGQQVSLNGRRDQFV